MRLTPDFLIGQSRLNSILHCKMTTYCLAAFSHKKGQLKKLTKVQYNLANYVPTEASEG